MQAMQYEITLPAGHDMRTIHRRVADKGHLTDHLPGLALKAYLVRERGTDGSPVNQYAPLYLWHRADAMDAFLRGPGFRTLSEDFGRPPVRHWLGHILRPGPAVALRPRTATRVLTPLPEDADPAEVLADALARPAAADGDGSGLHSTALALDPYGWELLRFSLWCDDRYGGPPAAPAATVTRYRVLHLSAPELPAPELPTR
ncbi:DUF4865 family protein [Kitasatospora sp. NPDC048540]|uniref:DUF4865 family protein n=1 Tax=unclassified Kitasatospora TaxID=2633591 RepID=UPI00053A5AB8|nr:DUF4865 family protein [Kitasatospora sp. MBT63]